MIVNLTDVAKSKYNEEEFKLVSLLKKIIEDDTYDVSSMKNEDNTTSYSITYTLKNRNTDWSKKLSYVISASKMTKDEIESLFKKALKNGDLVGINGLTNPEEYLDLRFQDFRQDRKNIEGKIGIDFTVPEREISLKEQVDDLSKQITIITNTLDILKDDTTKQITNITNTLDTLKNDTTGTTSTTTSTTVEPITTTSTTTDEPTTTDDTVDTTTTTTTTTGTDVTTTNEDVKGE